MRALKGEEQFAGNSIKVQREQSQLINYAWIGCNGSFIQRQNKAFSNSPACETIIQILCANFMTATALENIFNIENFGDSVGSFITYKDERLL